MPHRTSRHHLETLHQRTNDLIDRLRVLSDRQSVERDPYAAAAIAAEIRAGVRQLEALKSEAATRPDAADVVMLIDLFQRRIGPPATGDRAKP